MLLEAAGKGMHTKSCLQCMEGGLIWSGRSKCHPLGIHPSAISISPHTSPFQDVPVFCSGEMELHSMAGHGQMLEGASTNQRNQSGAEPWDCGRNDAVVPLSLIFTLQCISSCIYAVFCLTSILGLTNQGQKQEPDHPPQSFAEIMFLHLRNFTSSQARNGNQVKQSSSSALHIAAAFLGFTLAVVLLSQPKEALGLSFVCTGSSPSAFQGQPFPGPWAQFT